MTARTFVALARLYWPLTLILFGWLFGLAACGASFGLAMGYMIWGRQ